MIQTTILTTFKENMTYLRMIEVGFEGMMATISPLPCAV